MFDVRLRLYTPQGVRGRVLKTLTLDWDGPVADPSSIRFTTSERVAGYLAAPIVVALEYSVNGSVWVEPRNARMVAFDDETDAAADAKVVTWQGMNLLGWLLSKTYVHWSSSAKDGERKWTDRTSGYIMHGLLTEAKNRGWGPYVTLGFTASVDGNGVPWPSADQITESYRLLTPMNRVLEGLVGQGLCEYWTEGNTLKLVVPGTGVDRGSGSAAPVLLGPTSGRRPYQSSSADIFTHLTVVPEKASNWLYLANPGADSQFGRLEATMTQAGVASHATATRLAQPTLLEGRSSKREVSIEEAVSRAKYLPFIHYNVGDLVRARVRNGWENLRIVAITIRKDAQGVVTTRTTLSYRRKPLQARLAGKQSALTAGTFSGGAGNTPMPALPGVLNPPPNAPTGVAFTANVGGYDENGTPQARLTLSWDAVGQATDGSEIDAQAYEVWVGRDGGALQRTTAVEGLTASLVVPSGLAVQAKVRALSVSGLFSAFSDVVGVTAARDTTPTAPPTAPVLFSTPGGVIVEWDGLLTSGPPPVEFRHVIATVSATEAGTYLQVGAPFSSGSATIVSANPGDQVWVKLLAVDSNGNVSAPSAAATIVVTPEPVAPSALVVISNVGEFDELGVPRSRIVLDWADVTLAVNGSAVSIAAYEVWIGEGTDEPSLHGATVSSTYELVTPPDGSYVVRVRAVSTSGLWSAFSSDLSFTAARDTTPLAAPTAPTLSSALGTVRVVWDGLLTSGAVPARFRRAYAATSSSESGTYSQVGAPFDSGGTLIAGLTVGSTVWVRLFAVGSNGIVSAGSTAVSVVVQGVGAGEIEVDAITIDNLDSTVTGAIEAAQADADAAQTTAGTALSTANGKNAVWRQPTAPTGTAHAVDDIWFDTDDGNRIYLWDGANWTAAQFGSNAIANAAITNALIANLDAGKINTGTLDAARIAAQSISTQKLVIASFTNLLEDPGFELSTTVAWSRLTADVTNVTTNFRSGARAQRIASAAAAYEASRHQTAIAVQPGESYLLGGWVRTISTTAPDGGISFGIAYGATAAATTTTAIITDTPALAIGDGFRYISGVWTVPAGVYFIRPFIRCEQVGAGTTYMVDDMALLKRYAGELIVDGAITTPKLAAGSVVAEVLAADSVSTNALQAGAVTTEVLAADCVTANELAAGSVTANAIVAGIIEAYHLAASVGQSLDISSNTSINLLVGDLAAANANIDSVAGTVEEMGTYYQFGSDEATISSPSSTYELALSPAGIQIRENGVAVSTWDAGQMLVSSMVVETVVLGNHQIEKYGTGTVVRKL